MKLMIEKKEGFITNKAYIYIWMDNQIKWLLEHLPLIIIAIFFIYSCPRFLYLCHDNRSFFRLDETRKRVVSYSTIHTHTRQCNGSETARCNNNTKFLFLRADCCRCCVKCNTPLYRCKYLFRSNECFLSRNRIMVINIARVIHLDLPWCGQTSSWALLDRWFCNDSCCCWCCYSNGRF